MVHSWHPSPRVPSAHAESCSIHTSARYVTALARISGLLPITCRAWRGRVGLRTYASTEYLPTAVYIYLWGLIGHRYLYNYI